MQYWKVVSACVFDKKKHYSNKDNTQRLIDFNLTGIFISKKRKINL